MSLTVTGSYRKTKNPSWQIFTPTSTPPVPVGQIVAVNHTNPPQIPDVPQGNRSPIPQSGLDSQHPGNVAQPPQNHTEPPHAIPVLVTGTENVVFPDSVAREGLSQEIIKKRNMELEEFKAGLVYQTVIHSGRERPKTPDSHDPAHHTRRHWRFAVFNWRRALESIAEQKPEN